MQKARHCMVRKSTQLTTFTLTLSSTTLRLPTHIMRRYIKLTSASSIISLMGLSWHTIDIHAGYHNSCNLYHYCCLAYYFLLVDPKHFQQSSLITLLRCAELGCLRLSQFFKNQAKNNYHFAWMVDYVEEDHRLQTIQQNFTAEQHGKG